jgi:hypothetical protein
LQQAPCAANERASLAQRRAMDCNVEMGHHYGHDRSLIGRMADAVVMWLIFVEVAIIEFMINRAIRQFIFILFTWSSAVRR